MTPDRREPGVLDPDDRRRIARQFGVATPQVLRDHVISHALAAIATLESPQITFFGGTALSRTLLPDVRLSEDIDLLVEGPRAAIAAEIEHAVSVGLQRSFGTVTFIPRLADIRGAQPSVMTVGTTSIQLQILATKGFPAYPTEIRPIIQRYADAPPAILRVFTPAAFVSSKLAVWVTRRAPRDLYDLWALAARGHFTAEAMDLFETHGPHTIASRVTFSGLPSDDTWTSALAHQCIPAVGPVEAASIVKASIDLALA